MAGFAQGSRSGLSYVKEVTYGVTPATPSLIQIPAKPGTLQLTKETLKGEDITPDRMNRVSRHGNRQIGGDIVCDLRKGDFDDFLEGVFFNTWATNALKIGTTLKSFSIEDALTDIGQYRLFSGCAIGSMAVSIKPNQMVNTTFSFIGKDLNTSTTSVDPVKTAYSANEPFDAYAHVMKIADAGGSLASIATITGIDFTINNNINPTFVIGSATTPQLEYGRATVEGTLTAYVEDMTLFNRFLNETATAIEIPLDDPTGANTYTFLFPRCKLNTGEIALEGEASRTISISFEALYDATEGTNVKLTRSA